MSIDPVDKLQVQVAVFVNQVDRAKGIFTDIACRLSDRCYALDG
jgi:hypothetical protein